MDTAIDTLLQAARLAPSGDNTQPWNFVASRAENRIQIIGNSARDPSPMNSGNRMTRIAIGAALENMCQTAEINQWNHSVEYGDDSASLWLEQPYQGSDLDPAISERVSNRRTYNRQEASPSLIDQLKENVAPEGDASACWITEDDDRKQLCELIAQADSLMLSNKTIRDAFLEKVRFDQPVDAEVDEGLSLGCLELATAERVGMRAMRWIPDRLLKLGGIKRTLRETAFKLATSASGFCVVMCPSEETPGDYRIGRVFQRAWLEITRQKLASQPMMSLMVLRNIRENGAPSLNQQLGSESIKSLLDRFQSLKPLSGNGAPCAMLRYGFADDPSTRVGRLSIDRMKREN
tara:strand:- start:5328 stop:6374 length:1047 start_codon:yes stop_codon:yes gene_type:complete